MSFCSVCIPTYEMNGNGSKYLQQLFDTLIVQKGVDFQVVVSDQSNDDFIENLCKEVWYENLNIKFVKFDGKRHPCSNLNNAIKSADSQNIKIMFADDFFAHDRALINCIEPIMNGEKWLASACAHTYDGGRSICRPMLPRYHDDIHKGVNTISSPSVISFKNENKVWFDENLTYLLDVDWYKLMANHYGKPFIVETINVVNRIHQDSVSQTHCSNHDESVAKELPYILNKHK